MSAGFEFTSRYGPAGPPSWLRGCFECEAMGWSPTRDDREDDGWRFEKCRECRGTGRVSWLCSAARIPRWLTKASAFAWREGPWSRSASSNGIGWSYWKHARIILTIAFVEDWRRIAR